jgi:hypothetical protein
MKLNPAKLEQVIYNTVRKALRNPMPIGATCSKDYSTQNRYDIADELGIPNEYIKNILISGDKPHQTLDFTINGVGYWCKLTSTGRVKKHSVRKS